MTCLIGIAGGSGSGKTTFAKKLVQRSRIHLESVSMDSYYLAKQPEENLMASGRANFDHPNAFDWPLLRAHILELKEGNEIPVPVYDFKSSSRTEDVQKVKPGKVVLVEGIFSLFDEDIRELLDIKVYLQVEADIRFSRRINRDVRERGRSLQSIMDQYYETVRPMHQKYIGPQKQYADFIVGEETDVAADILVAKIDQLTQEEAGSESQSPSSSTKGQ